MKKVYYLPQSYRVGYLDGRNKSKSPLNNFRKTPPKNVFQNPTAKSNAFMGISFSSKTAKKGMIKHESQVKSNTNFRNNFYSTDLLQEEELFHNSHIENAEERVFDFKAKEVPQRYERGKITRFNEQQQLFGRSLKKIADIKSKVHANNLNSELNEVLNMIKEEKLKINEKLKIMQKNNDYYKQLCDGYQGQSHERGTNTEQILDSGSQIIFQDEAVQVQFTELQEKINQKQPSKNNLKRQKIIEVKVEQQANGQDEINNLIRKQKEQECYAKLCSMLDQMNINYRQILPEISTSKSPESSKVYKPLADGEVIKIQKFFIKKLASKIAQ